MYVHVMADVVLRQMARALTSDLELLLTSRLGFGLTTASPLQRAICRALDGRPLDGLEDYAEVRAAFGGESATRSLPRSRPREACLLSAARAGKSMLAGAIASRATQTCDMSALAPGDPAPRVSCVSLHLDTEVVYEHITNAMRSSPTLSSLLVRPPAANELTVVHPTGRSVDICRVAGARAGGSLISRWSAGVVFDEAPRMLGASDGTVVNLDDARRAVFCRMLPGAQIVEIGSPWAPMGPVYELMMKHWANPSEAFLAIRAPGPAMNPAHWTPERCEQLRLTDSMAYRTDALGEFADPEESLFGADLLRECTSEARPEPGLRYSAAIDPASRSNAWTLVIVARHRDGVVRTHFCRQWVPKPRLLPGEVLDEIREIVAKYPGAESLVTDQWSADAIATLARERGLWVYDRAWTAERKVDLFGAVHTALLERTLTLCDDSQLRADLQCVKKKATQAGVSIAFASVGNRHADYAPALALALEQARNPAELATVAPPLGTADRANYDGAREKAAAIDAANAAIAVQNRRLRRVR